MNTLDQCPICQKIYVAQCNCIRSDRYCVEGHSWHYCTVHGFLVRDKISDHSLPTCICTCEKEYAHSEKS